MDYSLNIGEWNSVFAVPSGIVDKYIKLASGNSLKLLLFLLRHGGEAFTPDRLRAELDFNEVGELEDAALFWVQRGVIRYSGEEEGKFTAAREEEEARITESEAVQPAEAAPLPAPKPAERSKISPVSVSSGEIASRIREDSGIKALFEEAEKLYGRTLRQRDNQTIISLVDHYGLPVGVSLMLLRYCARADKLTPSYISAAAADWSDNDITTIEKADARIRSLEKQNTVEDHLREALEMTTAFSPAQKQLLRVWLEDWGFSEDMVLLSINKTIEQIGKPKFNYANKILENWRTEGISTVEQASNPPSAQKRPEKNSSFDMDDVMSKIANRYKG